ncbi:BnaCnng30040D [Brassica napus]|uniref:(rape) hypothetical protein n=1 Tax=Brassica napus TaxID=3708 RepID=A0A078J018_BRANA|nr:unnamed protein product [Brassica napus]CDY56263.1 BnaCnng30040D [Brassica napus]
MFAFGYDKSCSSHKIFRLSKDDNIFIHIDIYDLSSDSWKTPDVAFHRNVIEYTKPGLSLKGNTYWYAYDKESRDRFLHCFDFTRGRFGPRLPPPVDFGYGFNVSLSSVKEEKLALLLKPQCGTKVAVWVTEKIEPDAVSWSKLFKVEMLQLNCGFLFGSFLIDEEKKTKKTVVVFDDYDICRNISAYIIDGENGHFRKVGLNESRYSRLYNLVSNYVPSSVHIEGHDGFKRSGGGCGSLRIRMVAISSGFKRFVRLVLRLGNGVFAGYL